MIRKAMNFTQYVIYYLLATLALFVPIYAITNIPILVLKYMGYKLNLANNFSVVISIVISNSFWIHYILKVYAAEKKEKNFVKQRQKIEYTSAKREIICTRITRY